MNTEPILLFDGECGFCNRSVRFLLKIDRKGRLRFAPLKGKTASLLLGEMKHPLPDSAILADNGTLYFRSDSILHSLILIGRIWGFLGRIGLIFPRFVRDRVYDWIARNRFLFKGKNSCALPTEDFSERFLD